MLHDPVFLTTDEIFVDMSNFAHSMSLFYIETYFWHRQDLAHSVNVHKRYFTII